MCGSSVHLKIEFTSLTAKLSAAASLELVIVCWPMSGFAQTVHAPQIGIDQSFHAAPLGTGGAAQQGTFLEFTAAARRAMKKLAELNARGGLQAVTAEEKKQLGILIDSNTLRFRVGMFVEYVTSNMLKLYELSATKKPCDDEVKEVAGKVQAELSQIADLQKGLGNHAVFRQNKAVTKVMCP
jgi:hypothetical protein